MRPLDSRAGLTEFFLMPQRRYQRGEHSTYDEAYGPPCPSGIRFNMTRPPHEATRVPSVVPLAPRLAHNLKVITCFDLGRMYGPGAKEPAMAMMQATEAMAGLTPHQANEQYNPGGDAAVKALIYRLLTPGASLWGRH